MLAAVTDFVDTHTWNALGECVVCGYDVLTLNVAAGELTPPPCVTRVVQKGRYQYHVDVTRPSIWGNPFRVGVDGDKGQVVDKFEAWIQTQPALLARLPELRGKILGCVCADEPCHAYVLARLADAQLLPKDPPVLEPDDIDGTVIIIDTETTGTDKGKDQVIELAIQFGFGDDAAPPVIKTWRFNPTVPIHPGALRVHGITSEMLATAPPFKVAAQNLAAIFEEAQVIIGYNVAFDLDMLAAEFARAGLRLPELQTKSIVDPYRLWQRYEPKTLAAAHQRFVGGDFANAHSAAADIAATGQVTLGMLETFGLAGQEWAAIAEACDPERKFWLGYTNHFKWVWDADGPTVVVTFGKHKDAKLHELATQNRGYLTWMLKQDFPPHVMQVANKAITLKGGQDFLAWAATTYPPPPPELTSEESG